MVKRIIARVARMCAPIVDYWCNYVWHRDPLGSEPQATAAQYVEMARVERGKDHRVVNGFESETGFSIDPEWFHGLALQTQITVKHSGLCYQHGRLLEVTPEVDPKAMGLPRYF